MMDQGWHHQGFRDQNGCCFGGCCSEGSAEGVEFTGGLHGGEIVVATDD